MRSWAALLLITSACGGEATLGAPDATLDDASDGAMPFLDSGGFPDSYVDSNVDPIILGDAGGPFLCGSCVCDGRTHYCNNSSGPGAPVLGDASDFGDASACGDAGGWPGCMELPAPCASQPSCKCLIDNGPNPACTCRLDTSGAGLIYGCIIP